MDESPQQHKLHCTDLAVTGKQGQALLQGNENSYYCSTLDSILPKLPFLSCHACDDSKPYYINPVSNPVTVIMVIGTD